MNSTTEILKNATPTFVQDDLAQLIQRLEILTQTIDGQAHTIHHLELKNQALVLELAHLRRIRYGTKTETFNPEQRSLFEENSEQDLAAIEAELEITTPAATKPRSRAGRQPLPEHLERIEHRHEPESCTCSQCGEALSKVREDISEQLDVVPAKFFVHRHIRPQYACRNCETITAAPVAAAVIDGGMAAPGLLAWIAVSKYLDHLPLYRLEQIAARQQVPLPRSTLCEWIGRIGVALQPLADRLAAQLKTQTSLHADETPVQQLEPGQGKTRRAYLWSYRSNDLNGGPSIIVFDYQPSRSGVHAQTFLGTWEGDLMVDDYSGYKALFRQGIRELGCWAHARRKFFELHAANQSPMAAEALERIGKLYTIEQQAKNMTPEQRQAVRQSESVPLLQSLHDWLHHTRLSLAQGSSSAKAIDYTLRRWEALIRYAQTGDLPIDNNPVENAIRPIALGKKNWLFAGSERAGRRAAAIQSLLGTAKLNGLDPLAWLKNTLEKLPIWPNRRIDELLPFKR